MTVSEAVVAAGGSYPTAARAGLSPARTRPWSPLWPGSKCRRRCGSRTVSAASALRSLALGWQSWRGRRLSSP